LVFSTKNREPSITVDLKPELHAYLGGLTRELKGKAYAVNGMPGHIHMLVSLPPVISISEALRFIKANSSGWVHEKWPTLPSFAWQLGYGAFSVSKFSPTASAVGYWYRRLLCRLKFHKINTHAAWVT